MHFIRNSEARTKYTTKIEIMKVFKNVTHNSISFIGYVFVISTPVSFPMAIKLYQRML